MSTPTAHIAIEIEHGTLTPVVDLAGNATRRTVPLTTIEDNQPRALVRLYLWRKKNPVLLREFDVTGLPPGRSGDTRFLMSCDFDGKHTVRVRLNVDGKPFATETLNLKRHLRAGIRRWVVGIVLALALAAIAAALLLPRGCVFPGVSDTPVEHEPGAEAEKRIAPDPEPEPEPEPTREYPADPSPEEAEDAEQEALADQPEEQVPRAPREQPTVPPPETPRQEPAPVAGDSETITELRREERELVVYFHPDDPRLTGHAREQIRELAQEIESWEDRSIEIDGHCALSGTEAGRMELSRQRAENSADALVNASTGVIAHTEITRNWFGATRRVTQDPREDYLNRRVEITVRGSPP